MTFIIWGTDFHLMGYNFHDMRKPTVVVGLRIRLKLAARVFNDLRPLVPHNAEVKLPHKTEVPPGIYA